MYLRESLRFISIHPNFPRISSGNSKKNLLNFSIKFNRQKPKQKVHLRFRENVNFSKQPPLKAKREKWERYLHFFNFFEIHAPFNALTLHTLIYCPFSELSCSFILHFPTFLLTFTCPLCIPTCIIRTMHICMLIRMQMWPLPFYLSVKLLSREIHLPFRAYTIHNAFSIACHFPNGLMSYAPI